MNEFMTVEDPFLTNVFDEPGIAVWLHEGEPGGPYYVVDVIQGAELSEVRLAAAMSTVPDDAEWRMIVM